MDLKALKLELLERIAQLDDEARLLALKRLLDQPRAMSSPPAQWSVVEEGAEPYWKLEDRLYTREEVSNLVRAILDQRGPGEGISDQELAELDRRHAARLKGTSKGSGWKESLARVRGGKRA